MRRFVVALALVSASASANAQRATEQETGSHIPIPQRARIPDAGTMREANRVRIVMAEFARCVVDRNYNQVAQALALPAGHAFSGAVVRLATGECLESGEMRFKPVAIRGPLFTELYRRRVAAEKVGHPWGPALAKVDLVTPVMAMDQSEQQHLAMMAFGDCVVKRDAEAARRVVLAPTAGDAQDRSIVAIAPNLGPCIVQGTTLHFGKQVLEGILAEVLYRGVNAPAMNPAAVEAK